MQLLVQQSLEKTLEKRLEDLEESKIKELVTE